MRAMWTGSISFGLVNIPVKAYTATSDAVELNYVHEQCNARVGMRWQCGCCDEIVPFAELGKGHNQGSDKEPNMIMLTADELKSVTPAKSKNIDVIEFVDFDEIDPTLFGSCHYLAPSGPARKRDQTSEVPAGWGKAYALLRETLRRSNKVAIVRVMLRQRESMAMLRVRDDVIVMQTLLYVEQVRAAEFNDYADGRIPDAQVSTQEMDAAMALVDTLTRKFDAAAHVDTYAVGVAELIAAKAAPVEVADTGAQVIDLFRKLDQAV